MNPDQSIIERHEASVGTSTQVQIDLGQGCQTIYIQTFSNDVYVGFNQAANTDSFRIPSANTAQSEFNFRASNVRYINLLAAANTANVYVMGVVGN